VAHEVREDGSVSKIIFDDAMRAKLAGLSEPVEVCAQDGRTIGHFVPSDEYIRSVYEWAKSEVSDEELNRVSQETGGRALAEIKKRLGWS
jgi:hypothetical protein